MTETKIEIDIESDKQIEAGSLVVEIQIGCFFSIFICALYHKSLGSGNGDFRQDQLYFLR